MQKGNKQIDLNKESIAYVCPFSLYNLTGTPIRTLTTIKAGGAFRESFIFCRAGAPEGFKVVECDGGALAFFYKVLWNLILKKPTVVHGITTLSVLPMFCYKLLRPSTKIVFEMHGWSWFESRGQMALHNRLALAVTDVFGFLFSNLVIVMSYSQKHFLQKKIRNRSNVEVFWGPVSREMTFEDIQRRDYVEIAYVGNSSFWQGLQILLDAANILRSKNQKIAFALGGFDFKDESKFPKYQNVTYFGKIENDKVDSFMKRADALVSPRIKGMVSDLQYPHKLSEYLASGRAVIATDVSDQKLIIEKARCGLVASSDAQSLALAIEKFAVLSYYERNDLGKKSQEFAKQNFSLGAFKERMHECYKRII